MFGRKRRAKPEAVPLDEAVRTVAACPCAEHQEALAAALGAADELLLMVVGPVDLDALQAEGAADEIQVATAVAPNGRSFLQAFTDLEAAHARFPDGAFLAVAAQKAFRMCLSNGNEGLLVTAVGDDAWAALTADGVVRLITDR